MKPRTLIDYMIVASVGIVALTVGVTVAGCGSEATTTPKPPTVAGELHQPGPPVVTQKAVVVPPPASAGSEAKADGRVVAAGASCGRERWNVKTATDPAAGNISLNVKATTIGALGAQPSTNTSGNLDQPRDSGVESTTYSVTGTLVGAKRESDSDIHLVLKDEEGHTMIAEIPNAPACTEPPITKGVSVFETQIEGARAAFVREFGEPSGSGFTPINHRVTVTGVGFFDVAHGQTGVAPNAVELHPVLAIADP